MAYEGDFIIMEWLKKLDNYANNITITNITNIYICIIMVIVPCTFLPYTFTFTKQLMITMLVSFLWAICFYIFKLDEVKKTNSKCNLNIKEKIKKMEVWDFAAIIYLILVSISALVSNYFPNTILGSAGRHERSYYNFNIFLCFFCNKKVCKNI